MSIYVFLWPDLWWHKVESLSSGPVLFPMKRETTWPWQNNRVGQFIFSKLMPGLNFKNSFLFPSGGLEMFGSTSVHLGLLPDIWIAKDRPVITSTKWDYTLPSRSQKEEISILTSGASVRHTSSQSLRKELIQLRIKMSSNYPIW